MADPQLDAIGLCSRALDDGFGGAPPAKCKALTSKESILFIGIIFEEEPQS